MKNTSLFLYFLFLIQVTNAQKCYDYNSCIKTIEAKKINNEFILKGYYKQIVKFAKKDKQKLTRIYIATADNYSIKSHYNQYSKDGYKKAKDLYNKALKLEPNNSLVLLKQSYVYENLYGTEKAIAFLNKLAKKHPNDASYIWRKAEILFYKCPYTIKCREVSFPIFKKALHLILDNKSIKNTKFLNSSGFPRTKSSVSGEYIEYVYAITLFQNGEYTYNKEILEDLKYIQKKIPNSNRWKTELLLAYLDFNETENANNLIQDVTYETHNLKKYYRKPFLLAYKYFIEKKYKEAYNQFSKLSYKDPKETHSHPLIDYYILLSKYQFNKNLITDNELIKFQKLALKNIVKQHVKFKDFEDLSQKMAIVIKTKKEEIILQTDKNILITTDLDKLFDYAAKAVKNKNIYNLKNAAEAIIKVAPEDHTGYLYLSFVNCLENDIPSAKENAKNASNFNYLDASNFAITSYISFLNNDIEASTKQMNFSYRLVSYPDALKTTLDDINWIEKETGKDCTKLKQIAKNANSNSSNSISKAKKIFTAIAEWQKGENYENENEVSTYLSSNTDFGKPALAAIKFIKGVIFYNKGKYQQAIPLINNFTNNSAAKNNKNLQYPLAQAYNYLADNSFYSSDYKSMLDQANMGLKVVKLIKTNFLGLDLLNNKLKAVTGLNNRYKVYEIANYLLREAIKNKNEYFEALANNSLGNYYVMSVLSSDRNKAFTYNQKAYNLAIKMNNKNLISSYSGNYSISLYQKNQKQKAKEVALKAMNVREELNDIEGAQILANNMGYMYYISKDYKNATKMFLKAIHLSEKHLENSSPGIQLALMNEYTSAYSGLIMTYKDTRNTAELFKIQDANRSRLLSKKLHQKAFGKNITDVQNQLTNDDVLVYYSLLGPGEMVATIITKNNATIKYNFPIDSWLKLKKRFVNFVKKKPNTINNHLIKIDEDVIDGQLIKYKDKKQAFSADDFNTFTSLTRQLMEKNDKKNAPYLDQFLKHWYSFLIAPLANDILGKKNLIIGGGEELNYLPFEAFKNSNNQYLLENYNVTYIPSVTVWSKLKERKYAASRKSLLAFGGATYYPPGSKEGKTRTKKDFYTIKKELTNKIKTNKKNLSNELTAFGFGGAVYLPGTLREVNNLKKIVLNAKVLIGNSMTESNIKKMNATGELSNYKWVHIATHGFASDNIPSLSGVMMTQNESEKNKGEDTFLLAHEIEKLNLKADMVVLSACETALGKIYGGEGINGLNSSLLVAGANNTLLSLWPVNDSGTMVLMTLMYQNMYLKNQTASIALTNAKRTMLKGEIGEGFKSVSMWAPFVLNGSGE